MNSVDSRKNIPKSGARRAMDNINICTQLLHHTNKLHRSAQISTQTFPFMYTAMYKLKKVTKLKITIREFYPMHHVLLFVSALNAVYMIRCHN